ncbi:MAG TPA: MFS transporter [Gemmatimonadales bacterium]|jgi:MFS family permease
MPADRRAAMRFIVCLGVVSLFADMTYEGAHSAVGPLLENLGASAAVVGFVAGFGEMIAASLRYFSGKVADSTRAYWTLTFAGYAINLIVVPALALVGSWQAAALLVIAERTGKALRGPARDVLLSEATEVVGHGWGFGIHAAMDQTGAVIGPLLVAASVARSHRFGPAFLWLAVPAALTLVALSLARLARPVRGTPPPSREPQQLPPVFRTYVIGAGLIAVGFIDFPLLAYHFQQTALFAPADIPLLYAGAMAINGITALVYGRLFDRFGVVVLALGLLLSMLALPLGLLFGPAGAIAAVACWAAGLGVQDATLRSGISQVVSMNKRGNAFGIFNGVYGVMWFVGSAVMGLLYAHALVALVVFGVAFQFAASMVFFRLRTRLATAS